MTDHEHTTGQDEAPKPWPFVERERPAFVMPRRAQARSRDNTGLAFRSKSAHRGKGWADW